MTAEALWDAINRETGRSATVSVQEFAEIVGISKISAHRQVARGDIATLKLPGLVTRRIPVSEVFRVFGVEMRMGTADSAAAPGETQDTVVASPIEVTP